MALARRDAYALLFLALAVVGAEAAIAPLLALGGRGHLVSLALPAAPRPEPSTRVNLSA